MSSKGDIYDNSAQSQRVNDPAQTGPHYEVPNLSSNFTSIRDLPTKLSPGEVLNMQQTKIEGNLYGAMEARGAHVKTYVELSSAGDFSKFDWKPDPFGVYLEEQREEARQTFNLLYFSFKQFCIKINRFIQYYNSMPIEKKQLQLHGNIPFYSQPNIQLLPRHLSAFQSANGPDLQAASAFYGEDDPYEATKEILREKWLSDSKILYGEFKPAHNSQNLSSVNKKHLPDIVGLIKRHLLADWSDINFVIGTNPEDFIEMRFDAQSLDSPKGLHAYLNNLYLNSNEMVLKFQLRRVTEYWGIFGDDGLHIYYMLAPPWCRIRNPTLYLKQIQGVSGGLSSSAQ